jgi:anti-sigma regulatory factor (Ser/Thr protein kinase)
VSDPLALRVRTSIDAVRDAAATALPWLQANRVGPAAELLANLAIEELVTNCMKYGYDDGQEHEVDIELAVRDRSLVIHVVDDGRPFNPVDAPPPDTTLAPEERRIGGLGLHMLRTFSDRMTYERHGRFNHLVLVKAIDEGN